MLLPSQDRMALKEKQARAPGTISGMASLRNNRDTGGRDAM